MIPFYAPKDPYGCFSNFSRHQVYVYNQTWATSEHPFQAMKFHPHRMDLVAKVGAAETPGRAARLGRNREYPLRPDWNDSPGEMLLRIEGAGHVPQPGDFHFQDDGIVRQGVIPEAVLARVKDVIMYEIVYAKFAQNEMLRAELLGTGDHALIEIAEHDPYWGWGPSRNGLNKLGRILMAVRSVLRSGSGDGVPLGNQ